MFQVPAKRFRAFLSRFNDVLGDPEPAWMHEHRPPLRWQRERRPGIVAARPAHCLSPLRSDAITSEHERAVH
jgi:hypothetical protein